MRILNFCDALRATFAMFCAIWYYLYNLKNVKNSNRGLLSLEKLQALIAVTYRKTLLSIDF